MSDVKERLEVAQKNFWRVSIFETFPNANAPTLPDARPQMLPDASAQAQAGAGAEMLPIGSAVRHPRRVLLTQANVQLYSQVSLNVPRDATFEIEADFLLQKPSISERLSHKLVENSQLAVRPESSAAAAVQCLSLIHI